MLEGNWHRGGSQLLSGQDGSRADKDESEDDGREAHPPVACHGLPFVATGKVHRAEAFFPS